MAETLTQKVEDLKSQVSGLAVSVEVLTRRNNYLETRLDAARDEATELRAELSATKAQLAALQRASDRGWNLFQAVLVLAVSIAASAVTQLALRK